MKIISKVNRELSFINGGKVLVINKGTNTIDPSLYPIIDKGMRDSMLAHGLEIVEESVKEAPIVSDIEVANKEENVKQTDERLNVKQVMELIKKADKDKLAEMLEFEKANENRKMVIKEIEKRLK